MSNAKNLATFLQSGGNIAGDANFDSNTLFVDSSANAVGIGTSSPSGAFTSAGGRSFFFSGDLYGIGIAQSSGQANYAYLGSDASGNLQVSDTQGNQIATFTQDNKVGIGQSVPAGQLHLTSSDITDQVIIENTDTSAAAAPDLVLWKNSSSPADNDALGQVFFRGENSSGTATNYAAIDAVSADVTAGTEDGKLRFQTRAAGSIADRLVIDGQNVGIGTSSPSANLEVNTGAASDPVIQVTNSNAAAYRPSIRVDNQHTGGRSYRMFSTADGDGVFGGGKFSIYDDDAGSSRLTIDNGGSVGIGNTVIDSNAKLDVSGGKIYADNLLLNDGASSSLNNRLGCPSANTIGIFTNDTRALTIDSSQRVGIGTSSPNAKLTVNTGNRSTDGKGGTLCIGGDADTTGGLTNNTRKFGFITVPHYENAEGNLWLVGADAGASSNDIFIGGAFTGYSAATSIRFNTAANSTTSVGTERMRIDSSGNVGIGTGGGDPSAILDVGKSNNAGDVDFRFFNRGAGSANSSVTLGMYPTNTATRGGEIITFADNPGSGQFSMRFLTSNTTAVPAERMRIASDGSVLVGTTVVSPTSTNAGLQFYKNTGEKTGRINSYQDSSNSSATRIAFYRGTSSIGSITTSSASTAYNTTSDYRLKENVTDITDGIERVKQLNPSRFNFIADADTTVDGFLAHEVSDIVPEAITGEKDAMRDEEYEVTPAVLDDDGNVVTKAVMGTRSVPDYQGIDQSKLVPLLTAALQEAIAKIETLETKVATLEGA